MRMTMTVVKGFRSSEIRQWGKRHLQPGAQVVSDGLNGFKALSKLGCEHTVIVTDGGAASMACEHFTWINTLIGNVKNAMIGAYPAINPKHLPRYLAEFCYRFNRRFDLRQMMPRFGYVAARTSPMPLRRLILAEDYG